MAQTPTTAHPPSPGPAELRWGITRPCRWPSTPDPRPRAHRSRALTATVDPEGNWSAEPSSDLANGEYTAVASQGDDVGHTGQSDPATFTVAGAALSYSAQVLADGPDGYWRMNETSGTTATDLAGGNDNAFYEAGYTLNQPGGLGPAPDPSVALNGTSGRVRTGSTLRLGSATGVTVEALVNPSTLSPSSQAIARKHGQYLLRLDSAGRVIWRLWKGGAVTELLSPAGVVTAGSWSHIAATYDGTTMRIYVNGTERAQRALAGPVDAPEQPPVYGELRRVRLLRGSPRRGRHLPKRAVGGPGRIAQQRSLIS